MITQSLSKNTDPSDRINVKNLAHTLGGHLTVARVNQSLVITTYYHLSGGEPRREVRGARLSLSEPDAYVLLKKLQALFPPMPRGQNE